MFAADAELDVRTRLPPERDAEAHHRADAFAVDGRERIRLQDFEIRVRAEERARVVAAHAERRLRQVVRAEGEEFRLFGDLVRRGARARDFDHRADLVGNLHLVFRHDFVRDAADERRLVLELGEEADERNHDFRMDGNARFHDFRRRLEDGARLHFRDFRIRDAETAAAVPEHRIELVQFGDAALDVLHGDAELLREIELLLLRLREEFVQRRVEQADRRGKPLERAEDAREVAPLIRQQLVHRRAARGFVRRENHLADRVDAVAREEHVLRARQPDALRPEGDGDFRLRGSVRVRAHAELRRLRAPFHQLREILERLGLLRLGVLFHEPEHDVRRRRRELAFIDRSRRAVDGEPFAFLDLGVARVKRLRRVVDRDARGAADADLAHLARDQRRVRGDASARGEDALGGDHAAQVLRRGFEADEQHLLPFLRGGFGALGVEVNASRRGARSRGKPLRDRAGALQRGAVEHGRERLVELVGGNAAHGRLPVDEPLALHLARDADRREPGALAVARLQHEDLGVLDRELEVLHVAEMIFKRLADGKQLRVRGRHDALERRHGSGRAHAGDDVLALRVHQIFAVEDFFAARRVARERHAGARFVARVPEDHRLHVDRRAPVRRNVVFLAIDDRAVVHPRTEDGADRAFELHPRIRRERRARALQNQRLEAHDELAQLRSAQLRVARGGIAEHVRLDGFDDLLERFVVLARALLHAEHDVAVHLNEAAVAVPREALVVRDARERLNRVVVETEVENRVHHARHRFARAGAHRDQQRERRRVAELLAELLLDVADGLAHVVHQRRRIRFAVLVVIRADFRADREARRNGQADAGHFREVGAFPAEKIFHRRRAVGLFAEFINEFDRFGAGLQGTFFCHEVFLTE